MMTAKNGTNANHVSGQMSKSAHDRNSSVPDRTHSAVLMRRSFISGSRANGQTTGDELERGRQAPRLLAVDIEQHVRAVERLGVDAARARHAHLRKRDVLA